MKVITAVKGPDDKSIRRARLEWIAICLAGQLGKVPDIIGKVTK